MLLSHCPSFLKEMYYQLTNHISARAYIHRPVLRELEELAASDGSAEVPCQNKEFKRLSCVSTVCPVTEGVLKE